jgi:hypothetical protein
VFFFWWGGGPIEEGPSPKEKKTYWISPKLINNNHIIPYHIVNTSVACAVGPSVNLLQCRVDTTCDIILKGNHA